MPQEFVAETCLPYLLETQNDDGGWGYTSKSRSRAEPTAWALLALLECTSTKAQEHAISRAFQFLATTQLADGSWPASPEIAEGCWVTSLACLAMLGEPSSSERVQRGLNWLCADVPGEARALRRFVGKLMPKRTVAVQNDSYYGWSWTPGTASWVEPTAYAVILMRQIPAASQPADAQRRQQLAAAMLLDRMCPGGGWNCGNPMVYGVPGDPQIGPTVWALLALKPQAERPEVRKSLDWLASVGPGIKSLGSLALAQIALNEYGSSIGSSAEIADSLRSMYQETEALRGIPEVAWTSLALSGTRNWLDRTPKGKV